MSDYHHVDAYDIVTSVLPKKINKGVGEKRKNFTKSDRFQERDRSTR